MFLKKLQRFDFDASFYNDHRSDIHNIVFVPLSTPGLFSTSMSQLYSLGEIQSWYICDVEFVRWLEKTQSVPNTKYNLDSGDVYIVLIESLLPEVQCMLRILHNPAEVFSHILNVSNLSNLYKG